LILISILFVSILLIPVSLASKESTPVNKVEATSETKEEIPIIKAEEHQIRPLIATSSPSKTKNVFYSTSTIREAVIKEFGTSSIMIAVASCESHFRQTNKDGSVFRGKQNPKDVGALQINEYYHLADAKKLGLNIHTLEGNIAYARILYDRNGTRDWNWSKPMWSKGECK